MTCLDQQRLLLEQLMGLERDVPLGQRTGRTRMFYDPDICKFYVAGLSPYTLFKGTKSDFGVYNKIIDDDCQKQFAALSQREKDKYGFERELMDFLDQAVRDLDRKIARINADLGNTQSFVMSEIDGREEERRVMLAKIEELNSAAEAAGDDGEVEQAMVLMEQAKEMKNSLTAVEDEIKRSTGGRGMNKLLTVCEVCGVKIENNLNADQLESHYAGKQYRGWKAIRDKLSELRAKNPPHATCRFDLATGKADDDSEQPVRSAGVGRNDGDRERASPRERERDRDRRDQWDDKDRRDKDRDRDRRDRDRDRDRDRRDRDRRDRNRDRDRDRDKKRKSSKEGSGEEGHTKKAKDGADDANA